jgi:predicted nucleic acid-binding protein
MIFLDTNIFLRLLTSPTDTATERMHHVAVRLFTDIRDGVVEATTTDLVLHEIFYVLTSKRQYGLPDALAIGMVKPIIGYRGLKLPRAERDIILRAIDIWERNPKLEFADSIVVARGQANGWHLATFDKALASIPEVTRWEPTTTE